MGKTQRNCGTVVEDRLLDSIRNFTVCCPATLWYLNAAIMLKESYRRNYLFASEMRMVRFSLRRKIGREV
ncbi:MAG: hypothetical protein V1909_01675, partial [Candidatus Micrarchaeota archaeon]